MNPRPPGPQPGVLTKLNYGHHRMQSLNSPTSRRVRKRSLWQDECPEDTQNLPNNQGLPSHFEIKMGFSTIREKFLSPSGLISHDYEQQASKLSRPGPRDSASTFPRRPKLPIAPERLIPDSRSTDYLAALRSADPCHLRAPSYPRLPTDSYRPSTRYITVVPPGTKIRKIPD